MPDVVRSVEKIFRGEEHVWGGYVHAVVTEDIIHVRFFVVSGPDFLEEYQFGWRLRAEKFSQVETIP